MTSTQVYIVKYALTSGILRRKGYVTESGFFFDSNSGTYYQRNEYCLTLREAEQCAENKRTLRINQLQQQISRLRGLAFNTTLSD